MPYILNNNSKLPTFDPYQNHMELSNKNSGAEKRGPAVYTQQLNNRIQKFNPYPFSTQVFSQGGKLQPNQKFYGNIRPNNALHNLLKNQKHQVKVQDQKHNVRHIKKEKKLHDLMTLYFKAEIEKRNQDGANKYLRSQMTPLEKEMFDNAEVDKLRYMKHLVGTNQVAMENFRTKQEIMDYFTLQNPAAKQKTQQHDILKDISDGIKTINKKGISTTEERDRGPTSAGISLDLSEANTGVYPSAINSLLASNPYGVEELIAEAENSSPAIGYDLTTSIFANERYSYFEKDGLFLELGEILQNWIANGWNADQVASMYPEWLEEFSNRLLKLSDDYTVSPIHILANLGNQFEGAWAVEDDFMRGFLFHLFPSPSDHTPPEDPLEETSTARDLIKTTDHTVRMGEVNEAREASLDGPGTLPLLPTSNEIALAKFDIDSSLNPDSLSSVDGSPVSLMSPAVPFSMEGREPMPPSSPPTRPKPRQKNLTEMGAVTSTGPPPAPSPVGKRTRRSTKNKIARKERES